MKLIIHCNEHARAVATKLPAKAKELHDRLLACRTDVNAPTLRSFADQLFQALLDDSFAIAFAKLNLLLDQSQLLC